MNPHDRLCHGDSAKRERASPGITVLTLLLGGLMAAAHAQSTPNDHGWSEALENRLVGAGTNRIELVKALNEASPARRESVVFLLENMPTADLKSLSAAFLLENLNLAYEGWEKSPWYAQVTKEMFFNDVLPYACLSEAREPWRAQLREVCAPIVAACRTPGEAAHLLNQKIFRLLKVRYNTSRRRPDQSPCETMKSGIATCTGLSILLVDACRSVGIPARVVGTPMWSNMRGNHTWGEVWDGDWHFAGAAEPDAAGLDRGWFAGSAARAQRESRWHAIYATSFRRTGLSFPLVWRPGDESVNAVNVTDRYTPQSPSVVEGSARLSVKVVESNGQRVVADIVVTAPGNAAIVLKDKSRGETADLNDFAVFKLAPGCKYHVAARREDRLAESDVMVKEAGDQLVTLTLALARPQLPGGLRFRPAWLPPDRRDDRRQDRGQRPQERHQRALRFDDGQTAGGSLSRHDLHRPHPDAGWALKPVHLEGQKRSMMLPPYETKNPDSHCDTTDRNLLFARPAVLSAARVRICDCARLTLHG